MRFRGGEKPVVHLYSICWNEETMLPFFFRHYDPLVERYVIFDDGSTDATLSVLENHPRVEVRRLPRLEVDSYVLAAKNAHDHAWKESRGTADWVITTAVDELLYTPGMGAYLAECMRKGITAVPALGFQMIAETLPPGDRSLLVTVRRGSPFADMNKLSVFDPDRIMETNQAVGRHTAEPVGVVKYPKRDQLLLLHYKYLSFEHTLKRQQELALKLGAVDRQNNWGSQYDWTRERLRSDWDSIREHAVEDVLSPRYDANRKHSNPNERWWRKDPRRR